MSATRIVFLVALMMMLNFSCNHQHSDYQIMQMLKSNDTEKLILGAFEAGESGKTKFVPLLLLNANNRGGCTNIRFKGFSVYQEKMIALRKLLRIEPPIPITRYPDSLIIRFYSHYAAVHHLTENK